MKTSLLFFAMAGFLSLASATTVFAQDWSQWRGANRDGKVYGFKAPQTWPAELIPKWKVDIGLGDASPVMSGGKLYSFSRKGENEVIMCSDGTSGKEVWQYQYPALTISGPASSLHSGPRSTPAIGEGKIITLGIGGVLSCLDATNGKLIWRYDAFTKDLPPFFTGLSPLIVNEMCIVHLGGKEAGEIIAFDLKTGIQKWQCPGAGPSYASLTTMKVDGKKLIVDLTSKNLLGIDPLSGKQLWQFAVPTENRFYNAATPVIDGETVIFTGQGQGTKALRIELKGGQYTVRELWKNGDLGTKWNTPVLKDGFLYGLSDGRKLFCMNAQTGQTAWVDSRLHNDFGTIVDAGSLIIALPQSSNLVVFKPDSKGYDEVACVKVCESPTYSYPILAGSNLFIKDKDTLVMIALK